jgi:hypothetical protein
VLETDERSLFPADDLMDQLDGVALKRRTKGASDELHALHEAERAAFRARRDVNVRDAVEVRA